MTDKHYFELEPLLLDILANGATFHGKFTCAHCGARQRFEKPNILFTKGVCEECGETSELDKWGVLLIS